MTTPARRSRERWIFRGKPGAYQGTITSVPDRTLQVSDVLTSPNGMVVIGEPAGRRRRGDQGVEGRRRQAGGRLGADPVP